MTEFFFGIFTCFILLIGVAAALIELNSLRKQRHSELLMDLYKTWEDEPLLESRKLIKPDVFC
jgi:hypothetical protein